jgi:hypothetical protein
LLANVLLDEVDKELERRGQPVGSQGESSQASGGR